MNKVRKIKKVERDENADNLNNVMSDAFGDPTDPSDFTHIQRPQEEAEFEPFISRAVTIEELGGQYSVTASHKMHFEQYVDPLVKNSIYYYEKSADAVSMAKAFFGSHKINMTKDKARVAKKLATEKVYKQLSFIDLL